MAKASSSKKVARAAGLGGSRAYGSRPPWGFYFAVVLLVILGVVGVYNSREYRQNQINNQGNGQPAVNMATSWFEGFAVDICGKLQPPVKTNKDPFGITTKGDGIIYINPTVKSAAGHNATLGKFASAIGMTLNAAEIQLPGGKLYQVGDNCQGKPGHVYVMTWSSPQAPRADGVLQDKQAINTATGQEDTCSPDCNSGVLLAKNQLVTIAFVPAPLKGKTPSILQPPQSVVSKLTSLVANGGTTTTTPVPSSPSTTAASTKTGSTKPSSTKTSSTKTSSTKTSAVTATTVAGSTTKPKPKPTSKTTATGGGATAGSTPKAGPGGTSAKKK